MADGLDTPSKRAVERVELGLKLCDHGPDTPISRAQSVLNDRDRPSRADALRAALDWFPDRADALRAS